MLKRLLFLSWCNNFTDRVFGKWSFAIQCLEIPVLNLLLAFYVHLSEYLVISKFVQCMYHCYFHLKVYRLHFVQNIYFSLLLTNILPKLFFFIVKGFSFTFLNSYWDNNNFLALPKHEFLLFLSKIWWFGICRDNGRYL